MDVIGFDLEERRRSEDTVQHLQRKTMVAKRKKTVNEGEKNGGNIARG